MHLPGQIIFRRATAPQEHILKRIGALYWSPSEAKGEVRLRGWHKGICGVVFDKTLGYEPPYLHGDLIYTYRNADDKDRELWVGRIGAEQKFSADTHYWLTLEVMPIIQVRDDMPDGLKLEVKQDDDKPASR